MKKKLIMTRILPVLLTLAMLIGMVPFAGIGVSADTTDYAVPTDGDVAWVKSSSYAMEDGTVKDNSGGMPSGAYSAVDNGVTHSIRNITFREAGYGGTTPNYDPDLQLYCIEYGKGFSSHPEYTAYKPSEHTYWTNQTETEREGVMLAIGLGYPASSLADLGGVKEGDAIAATQILVWEFDAGYRTSYTGTATNPVLYNSCIKGTDAETAYWTILGKANEYVSAAGYSFEYLEEHSEFVLFALDDAQTVMVYALPGNPPEHEAGVIEVYKKDPNGRNLSGAMFSATNTETGEVIPIGPTNSNGYAITDGGTDDPQVPFGTYVVRETKAPEGHLLSDEVWEITLDGNTPNGVITINAVNTPQTVTYTPVVYKKVNGKNPAEGAFTFDISQDGVWKGLAKNDANGKVTFASLEYSYADVGKTYTYSIYERIPAEADRTEGMIYDNQTYKFSVTISYENGKLIATGKDVSGRNEFNNALTGSLEIYKVDDNKAPLAGAEFTIYLEGGGVLTTVTTNEQGYVTADHLAFGTYTVKETKAPDGYIASQSAYKVVVDESAASVPVKLTVVNHSKDITGQYVPVIYKELIGRDLAAGEFTFELVDDESGEVIGIATNDADGKVAFDPIVFPYSSLTNGVAKSFYYTIYEVSGDDPTVEYDAREIKLLLSVYYDAAKNYIGTSPYYVLDGNYGATATLVNTLKTSVTAEKVWDDDNCDGLRKDVQLTLTGSDGSTRYGTIELGETSYTWSDLPVVAANGEIIEYTLEEAAIDGYSTTIVKSDDGYGFTVTNTLITADAEISVIKRFENGDLEGGEFEFALTNDNNVDLQTKSNDADGHVDFEAITLTFADLGTHEYTVREKSGTLHGVSYDSNVLRVIVTVSDSGNGKLDVNIDYPDGNAFVNVYSAEGSAKIELEKDLIGADLTEGQFNFVLSENGADLQTKSNAADGKIAFDAIEYTLADVGVHTYTIREINDGKPGYTYSTKMLTVKVSVTDTGDGTLKVDVSYPDGQKIENTYKTDSVSTTINGVKYLEGRNLAEGEFGFVLSDANGEIETITNATDGKFAFKALTYTEAGTYTYTVSEKAGTLGGVTYDKTVYTVTVVVVDNGAGTLVVSSKTYSANGGAVSAISFTNTYKSEPTSTTIDGVKYLDGRDLAAGEFSFVLSGANGEIETVSNAADGKFAFKALTYGKAGTYTYTVSEKVGTLGGVTYDSTIYTVTVVVEDNGEGKLVVSSKTYSVNSTSVSSIAFTNTYNSEPTSTTIEGMKYLEGRDLTAGEFSFVLSDANGEIETVTNAADGKFTFSALDFDKAGTYTYTVSEKVGTLGGVSYDKTVYTITVVVEDNGEGNLVVSSETYSVNGNAVTAISFTNNYTTEPTSTTIEGEKYLEGRDLAAGEFSFVLSDVNGEIETVTNSADGKFAFSVLNYEKAGTYTYTVREKSGTLPGVSYDDKVLSVVVTVVDLGNGKLDVKIDYPDGNTFANVYSSEGSAEISVIKRFENGNLKGGEFEFELVDADGNVIDTATNDTDGNVDFKAINLTLGDVGEHRYTVREKSGTLPGVSYDGNVLSVVVTVSDLGNGKLDVKIDYPDGNSFVNVYSAEGSAEIEALKTLIGTELTEGRFNFVLSENGVDLQTKANAANGKITFDAIEYTLADVGVHTYTIREINDGKPGYTYSTKVLTVKISVTDAGDGTLKVDVSYPDGQKIENTYSAKGSAKIELEKDLIGTELTEGQFNFVLSENGIDLQTKANAADGKITFDAIEYTLADVGIHTYTIREIDDGKPGYTYSTKVLTVKVNVTDNGDGTLKAVVSYPDGNSFVNVYSAKGSAKIELEKDLIGTELTEGQFDFVLSENDTDLQTKSNAADGKIVFDAIEYTLVDVGEHRYYIREIPGNAGGITYDDTVIEVLVTVSDNKDGTLKVDVSYPDGNSFVNEYSAEGSAEISVIKRFENGNFEGGEFEFELVDENGSVVDSAFNDANGNVDFDAIDLTLADVGEHRYTVREKSGTLPGVSYDGNVLRVIVTVSDLGNGKLDVNIDYPDGNAFVNVYSAEGSAKIELEKDLIGADLTEGQFNFVLSENGADLQTKPNAADGKITFDAIEYTLADCGIHTYEIREINDGKPGYSYSTKVLTVKVNVTDNGDGTLKAVVSYPDGQEIQNTYSASGSFKATAWKQLIGKQLVAGMFTFELVDVDETVLDKATNDADGLVSFDAIEYTLADVGEHRYYIREIPGNAGGITYDETVIEIVVTVSDNKDGTLKVDVDYLNGDTLVNTYDASAEYTPTVQKVLTGTALLEGQFTFILTDEDGKELDEDTNDADGKVIFDTIRYGLEDAGKTYTYTIREVNDGQPGYSYDEHFVTITVSISDAGDGTLDLNITYDGSLAFENHYGATGSWTPELFKELTGRKLEAGQFTFELVGAITGEVVGTATNDENGVVTFKAIEFNENYLGVHMYILREVNDGKPGYSYDEHRVEVSILVEDNGDGTLAVTPTYKGELVYRNTYSAQGSALIEIHKELLGKELEGGEFEFEIKNEAGERLAAATNDADGKIVFGMLTLDETMVGTHYFTINEVRGDLPGITYTDKIQSVEVTAVDNGDGTLTVNVNYPAGDTFVNIYNAEGDGSVSVLKEFANGTMKGGEFVFELVDEDGAVIDTASNQANGRVQFGTMEFTLEDIGEHRYTVRERKGDLENVVYTDKELRVIIIVSDAGNGELNIDISYPDGTTLVNVYDEPEVPQTGDHTLICGGMALVSLICGAVLIFKKRKKIDE